MTVRRLGLDRRIFDLLHAVAQRVPRLSVARFTFGDTVAVGETYRLDIDGVCAEYTTEAGDGEEEALHGLADAMSALGLGMATAVTDDGVWGLDVSHTGAFWPMAEWPLQLASAIPASATMEVGFGMDGSAPASASVPGAVSILRGTRSLVGRVDDQGVNAAKLTATRVQHGVQIFDVLIRSEAASLFGRELVRVTNDGDELARLGFGDLSVRNAEVLLDEATASDTLWSQRTAVTLEVGFADVHRPRVDAIETVEATGTTAAISTTVIVPE